MNDYDLTTQRAADGRCLSIWREDASYVVGEWNALAPLFTPLPQAQFWTYSHALTRVIAACMPETAIMGEQHFSVDTL